MVPPEPFSRVHVVNYKRSFTFQITVLAELAEVFFVIAECAARFEEEAAKKKVFRDVSSNGVVEALLKNELMNNCSARRRTSRDVFI